MLCSKNRKKHYRFIKIISWKNQKTYFFIAIILFSYIQVKDLGAIDDNLKEQTAFIQSQCLQCTDLNEVSCVKDKINCYVTIDQYIRNKCKLSMTDRNCSENIKEVDLSNTNNLKAILRIHTWPIISKFGPKTDHQAWILAQHADNDPDFQASIAFILEQLSVIGETDIKNFAYLYDRVAVGLNHIGIKQKDGTQTVVENKAIRLAPFQGNIKSLNTRRQAIGLNPIEEYLNELSKFYKLKPLIEQD